MATIQSERLNINELLRTKKNIFISTRESLSDVVPINWGDDVFSGDKRVILTEKKEMAEE
jgi:hypothetical protein